MASIAKKKIGFDLLQSKEFERHGRVKTHAKAHVILQKQMYEEVAVPPIGFILQSVATTFDKCFVKHITPSKSSLGFLSILLVKYVDVKGKFSIPDYQITYTPRQQIPLEGIHSIQQIYFEDPTHVFRKFHTELVAGDLFPNLLLSMLSPWALSKEIKIKKHTPTTIWLDGVLHNVLIHSIIIPKTSMRAKNEIYAGHPEAHCYFVTLREFPRFLLYISGVAEGYIDHQMEQIANIKSTPVMKQFYKREGLADMAVFGSLAGLFLSYVFFPAFTWWNILLLVIGAGGLVTMAGFYAHLFLLSWQKKRAVISDEILQLDSRSHRSIEKRIMSEVFKKTFIAEFSIDPGSSRLDSSLSLHNSRGEKILSILKRNVPPRIRSFSGNLIGFLRDLPDKISVWANSRHRLNWSKILDFFKKGGRGLQKMWTKLIQRRSCPLVILSSPTPQKISPPPKTTVKVTKIGTPGPVIVDRVEEEAEEKDENAFKSRNIAAFLAD